MEPHDQPAAPSRPRSDPRITDGRESGRDRSSGSGGDGGGAATLLSEHWRLIAAMTMIAVAVSVAATYLTSSTRWEATDLVRVGPPAIPRTFSDPAYINQVLQTVQRIASDEAVVDAAWRDAGVSRPSGEPDPNAVSVEAEQDTELLRFTVVDDDPGVAQKTLEAMLDESRRAVDRIYGNSLSFTPVDAGGEVSEVRPAYLLNALAAGVAGLLLGFAIAALIERWYAL
jgi:capsular polysaccharide biosynthesis protein